MNRTNYLAEIHGLVFVVDSSTSDRMDECRRTLSQLLNDHRVIGKPLLLFVLSRIDSDSYLYNTHT